MGRFSCDHVDMEPPPQVKSRGRGTWRQSLHLGRFPFRVIGNDGDSVRCLFIINPFSCAPLFIAQTEATERLFIRFFFASSVILYTGRWVASSSFFFNEQHNPVSHFFMLRLHSSISVCSETREGLRGGCRAFRVDVLPISSVAILYGLAFPMAAPLAYWSFR